MLRFVETWHISTYRKDAAAERSDGCASLGSDGCYDVGSGTEGAYSSVGGFAKDRHSTVGDFAKDRLGTVDDLGSGECSRRQQQGLRDLHVA